MTMRIDKLIFGIAIVMLSSCSIENNPTSEEKKSDGSNNTEFIWDFSKEKKYVYSYSQTVNAENQMSKNGSISKSFMAGNGNVNIRVKSNDLADLSLTNLELSMVSFNDDGTPRDTTTDMMPTNVVQDMKPNGRFGEPSTDVLFDMLFPLPSYDFKEGESDKIPMKMPFNANGSRLFSEGYNTLTFSGFKTIEGRKCAVLKGEIDISKLEIPEELDGDYKSSTTGNATYYFDLKEHCYVGADIHMIMDIMMDSETDNEDDFGMFAKMKSDNVFKIRLERIE
ncbi:MAG: hypothetical protein Crog4KO_31070 [Crocinitomicaceae bacterium]